MTEQSTRSDSFTEFVLVAEEPLRQALTSALGPQLGREAAADALAHGWEHWDRVAAMDNAVGYLFRVGQRAGRRVRGRRERYFPAPDAARLPWVEPSLPGALQGLSDRQRVVVMLVHGYDWSLSEVAELMGVTKATVQSHADRALAKLGRAIGVER